MAGPFSSSSQQQSQQGEEVCVHAASTHALAIAFLLGGFSIKAGDRGQTYAFSRVFDAETTQQEYYEATAKPLVTDLLCNRQHNSVMMAYGITAAGKTYTIEGTKSQPGVMPRALKDLFDGLGDNINNSTQEVIRVKVSLCEVYNEQVYDLLLSEGGGGGEHQRPALRLKEDAAGRVIVGGLREIVVHNVDEALVVLRRGSKQRQRAGTGLNYASSRSHSIFTVILYEPLYEKKGKKIDVEIEEGGNNIGEEKVDGGDDETDNNNNNNHQVVIEEKRLGRIAFVDLAGSERAQRTGNVGVRLKESVAINSSLMTLGRCLEALRWNQKCHKEGNGNGGNALHLKVVPYRESKVTHLFRDALHGWGRVILSVNVSPVAADYDETSHVLKYAALATQIGTLQTGEAPRRRGTKVNKTPMVLKRKGGGIDDGGDGNIKKKMKMERQGGVPLTGQSQTVTDVVSEQQQQIEEVDEGEEEENQQIEEVDEVEEEEEKEKEGVSRPGQGRVQDREEESVSFTLKRRSLSAVSEPGGEFRPITSTTPPFIVNYDNDHDSVGVGVGAPLYYRDDGDGDAVIHEATTMTPQSNQSNAVTPIATAENEGDGDGDLEFVDEEEDVAGLQARVQQLITQLQAAEEKCVLIESEVRAEVAEEMSALLRDMEANYKERLMMSNNSGNGGGGGVPMSQVKDEKKAAAVAEVEEEEEMEEFGDDDDDSEGSPSSLISSPPSSATTTDNEKEEDSDNDSDSGQEEEEEEKMARKLKIDLSKAKERISELESQLEQLMECNMALQKELEEANKDGSKLYNEYQALQKQLEEAKENVTQVEANTTMEQELIENQLDREKKNNAMLQERLNAAMGALTAIGSPSTTIMQKLAAAHGNSNNSCEGFRNGNGGNNSNLNGGGMEPGHTPHDIALMRARRAAAAEEEQHQLLQQQLLSSVGVGPPPSTGSAGNGHNSMLPLSLPPPGTACGNRPSRFASQQPQRQAAGGGDDVPLSLPPQSIIKNNDDIKDEKEETEEEEEGKLGGGDDVEEEEKEKLTSEQKLKRRSSNRRRTTTTTTTTTISSIIEALDAAATTSSSPDDHGDDDEEEEDAEEKETEIEEVTEKEAVPVSEASPLSSPPMHYDDMECSPCQHKIEEEEEKADIALSSDAEGMEAEDKEKEEGEEDEDMSPIIGQPEKEDLISPASDEEDEEEEEESEDSLDEDDSEEESESESEEEEWAPSEEEEEEEEEEEKEIDDLVPTGIMKKNPTSRRVKKKVNSAAGGGGGGGGVEMKVAGHKKRSKEKGGNRGDKLEGAFNDAAVGEKEEDNAVAVQIEHTEKKKTTKRRLLNNPNSARMRNVLSDWNSMEEGEDSVGGVRAVSAEASAQVAIANLRRSGRARR